MTATHDTVTYHLWDRREVISEAAWPEIISAMKECGAESIPPDLQKRVDASPLALEWCGFIIQRSPMLQES